jgi:O-antigen/teichoic acid export membrane protein
MSVFLFQIINAATIFGIAAILAKHFSIESYQSFILINTITSFILAATVSAVTNGYKREIIRLKSARKKYPIHKYILYSTTVSCVIVAIVLNEVINGFYADKIKIGVLQCIIYISGQAFAIINTATINAYMRERGFLISEIILSMCIIGVVKSNCGDLGELLVWIGILKIIKTLFDQYRINIEYNASHGAPLNSKEIKEIYNNLKTSWKTYAVTSLLGWAATNIDRLIAIDYLEKDNAAIYLFGAQFFMIPILMIGNIIVAYSAVRIYKYFDESRDRSVLLIYDFKITILFALLFIGIQILYGAIGNSIIADSFPQYRAATDYYFMFIFIGWLIAQVSISTIKLNALNNYNNRVVIRFLSVAIFIIIAIPGASYEGITGLCLASGIGSLFYVVWTYLAFWKIKEKDGRQD